MPSPATCEIDDCGVLAVGRCAVCGRAFCGSHQATRGNIGAVVKNLCAPCAAEQERLRNLPNQLEEEAVAKALERIRSLAAELEQAGVPKTRYYRGTTKQYGWWTRSQGTAAMLRADAFGRYKTVENPAGHKYGWPVGVCPWSGTKTTPGMYGGGTTEVITVRMMTFVMTDGKVVNGDDPSAGTEYQTSRLRPEGQLSSLLNEIADRLAKHRPA